MYITQKSTDTTCDESMPVIAPLVLPTQLDSEESDSECEEGTKGDTTQCFLMKRPYEEVRYHSFHPGLLTAWKQVRKTLHCYICDYVMYITFISQPDGMNESVLCT